MGWNTGIFSVWRCKGRNNTPAATAKQGAAKDRKSWDISRGLWSHQCCQCISVHPGWRELGSVTHVSVPAHNLAGSALHKKMLILWIYLLVLGRRIYPSTRNFAKEHCSSLTDWNSSVTHELWMQSQTMDTKEITLDGFSVERSA